MEKEEFEYVIRLFVEDYSDFSQCISFTSEKIKTEKEAMELKEWLNFRTVHWSEILKLPKERSNK